MNTKALRQICIYIFLAVATSVAILAQQPTQLTASAERLRAHITYLASDALEGRRTGTPGAHGAAQYIAGEFTRLGLRPGMQNGPTKTRSEAHSKYMQKFPYVAGVELGKGSELLFKASSEATSTLRVSDDWMPLGLSSNGRFENTPAAFVDFGLTVAELKYYDYAGVDAAGKIVVALSGTPDGDNPHGQFARYEDARWKAIAARNAGAKALIVVAREESFNEDRLSRLTYDNSAGDAGLPVIGISRQAATRLFQLNTPANLSQLESAARSKLGGTRTERIGGYDVNTSVKHDLFKDLAVTLVVDVVRREVAASNVIGILEGSDPNLKNEAIVIGAHYDHLGRGGPGSLARREGEVHHGADDNASGTAGLLELARIFSAQRPKPRRTIVFIAFSGEEEGLLGSSYYVNNPVVPITSTVAMINMDMIGRMKGNKLIIGGVGTAQEWRQIINDANAAEKLTVTATGEPAAQASATKKTDDHSRPPIPIVISANGRTIVTVAPAKPFDLTLNEDGYGPSDHSSFNARKVPVLFMWTGTHEDYHKPSDTADKINYEDEVRVLDIVSRIVRDLDRSDKRPAYTAVKTESTGRAMGFRVYLGTIPNYSDSNDGLLLDGVRDDSPAAKAGLLAGDRIVKMAGRDVRNVYDYTYALGEMKAGQEYEVEVVRGNERLKLKLTPAARK
ncbi:MAG: M20/M25/M40 family metallo-hydrolase [Pyrinomonadaceae bacterium]